MRILNDRALICDLAWLITSAHSFGRDGACQLFRYQGGVYTPDAEFFIRQQVKHLLVEFGRAERWSRRLAQEVIEFILLDAAELADTPSFDLINLENGMLQVWTGELLPHSPQYLSVVRIPIRFDPAARCPGSRNFFRMCFPPTAWIWPGRSWRTFDA